MKKNFTITGVVVACLMLAGVPYSKADSFMKSLGLDDVKRPGIVCRQLGLYPVFEYKKNGQSRFYVTPFAPACVKAADNLAKAKAAGIAAAPAVQDAATPPVPTIDIKCIHKENTIKLDNGEYASAFWETLSSSAKLYTNIDTNFDGNTQIQVQCGGITYTTTLGDGDTSPWSDGTTPLTTAFEKGKSIIKSQYWTGVTNKGPDGKIKNDVTMTISWKPGLIQIKFTLKGPRNLPFVADNTNVTEPTNDQDGDITVTIVTFSIAITQNGSGTTTTWSLANEDSTGKKKTKVMIKKFPDGSSAYYPLVNWSSALKKAQATEM